MDTARQAATRRHSTAVHGVRLSARGRAGSQPPALHARLGWLEVLEGSKLVLPVRRLADDGFAAWAEVLERGHEGLVATDPASPYVGGRTLAWLKVKQPKDLEGVRGWESKRR